MGDYARWSPPYYEGARGQREERAVPRAQPQQDARSALNLKDERGREVLLRLAKDADVVLESFRPGVLDRLGVGYEQLKEVNPGIVYCAITGYGLDGPLRDRSGHDMNYLGLIGLLGLTGEADGPPVQSAGQIADVGGGALMAAFGILAALRERERSGVGQVVDVSMADGALSWLAMIAGELPRRRQRPAPRAASRSAGMFVCYRPYECADGWVTLGALEPKFFKNFCVGVGREDLIEHQFQTPGSDAHAQIEAIFRERTRAEWTAFAGEHDCCLEPVLDLDEALDSDLVREREMVVEVDQPGAGPAGAPARHPGQALAHARAIRAGCPGPGLGEHTDGGARARPATPTRRSRRSSATAPSAAWPQGVAGSFLS